MIPPDIASQLDSPFTSYLGLKLEKIGDGFAEFTCEIASHHTNRSGIVHGGVLLSLVDLAGGGAGLWTPEGLVRSVTLSLNLEFCRGVRQGRITATGTVASRSRNFYASQSRIEDEKGTLLALGTSTHFIRGASGEGETR